jgi:hypothetical protein
MLLTRHQTRLAAIIETHLTLVIACAGSDEELLVSLAEHMGTDTPLTDLSTGEDMYTRCQTHDGFSLLRNCGRGSPKVSPVVEAPCLHERQPLPRQPRAEACRDPPAGIAVLLVRWLNTPRVGPDGELGARASDRKRVKEYSEGQ